MPQTNSWNWNRHFSPPLNFARPRALASVENGAETLMTQVARPAMRAIGGMCSHGVARANSLQRRRNLLQIACDIGIVQSRVRHEIRNRFAQREPSLDELCVDK